MNVYMTTALSRKIDSDENFAKFMMDSLNRYKKRDWGDLCDEDKKLNDMAMKHKQGRIVARYNYTDREDDVYIMATFFNGGAQIEFMFCNEY